MDKTIDRSSWCASLWNGYVASGGTREERVARLAEVPDSMREGVRSHVETMFKVKASIAAYRARQAAVAHPGAIAKRR